MSLRICSVILVLAFSFIQLYSPVDSSAADIKKAISLNKSGEDLLAQGRISEAEQTFRLMLENCGDNGFCQAIGTFYLGRCSLESSRFDQAQGLLEDAEKRFEALKRNNEKAMVLISRGKLEVGKGDYRKALEHFKNAEALLQAEKNLSELFQVYNSRAVALTYLCQYDKAMECLDQAEELTRSAPNPSSMAVIKTNRGLIHAKRQQQKEALECFEMARNHYEEVRNSAALVTLLNNIGHVHESASRYGEAEKKHQEALEISKSIGDESGEALCLNNLGCVKLRLGDYDGARAAFELALEKRNRLGIKHFASETLNNLGLARLSRGEYSVALADFDLAERECSSVGSVSCRAWTLHNKAFLFKDMGRFRESFASSTQAVKLAGEIGDRRLESTATLRLGNLYEYEGWFDKATEEYVKAAEMQQEIGDLFFKANTFSDLANVLIREGDCGEAEGFLRKSLKLKQEIGSPQVEILCKMALFMLEKDRYCPGFTSQSGSATSPPDNLPDSPAGCIEKAKKLIQPNQGPEQLLLTYTEGRFLLESDPASSLKVFQSLGSNSEKMGIRKYSFLANVGEGMALEQMGQLQPAREAFKRAVDYAEQIRESLDERARLKFLDGEEILGIKHILPFKSLARVLLKLGMNEESLKVAEYTKSRNFSEALARRNPQSNADAPQEVLEKDANLNNTLAGLLRELELAELNNSSDTVIRLKADISRERNALQDHVKGLRQKYPLFALTKYPEPVPLSQTGLGKSELALVYDVTDTGILIYLVEGQRLVKATMKQISRRELESLVRSFRQPMEVIPGKETISDKLKTFDLKAGKKLSDLLVTDSVSSIPKGASLIIVPDDCLGTIPFEMLPLNEEGRIVDDGLSVTISNAEFLGDRNDISYYQSLTALTLARSLGKNVKPERGLLMVADPVFHTLDARVINTEQTSRFAQQDQQINSALMDAIETSSMGSFKLGRLPLTGELAESLADVFDQDATLFTGLEASKNNVLNTMKTQLHEYSSLVFATHGYFSPDNPVFQEPILFLTLVPAGVDGFLRMSEVMGLDINSDIVALTACQTGLGKQINGEGTMGMGRAFQYAGAKSALISLWSVSERASVKLVENFFQNLRTGLSRREALKKARENIRSEGFDHPFYWAAFILFGETS